MPKNNPGRGWALSATMPLAGRQLARTWSGDRLVLVLEIVERHDGSTRKPLMQPRRQHCWRSRLDDVISSLTHEGTTDVSMSRVMSVQAQRTVDVSSRLHQPPGGALKQPGCRRDPPYRRAIAWHPRDAQSRRLRRMVAAWQAPITSTWISWF